MRRDACVCFGRQLGCVWRSAAQLDPQSHHPTPAAGLCDPPPCLQDAEALQAQQRQLQDALAAAQGEAAALASQLDAARALAPQVRPSGPDYQSESFGRLNPLEVPALMLAWTRVATAYAPSCRQLCALCTTLDCLAAPPQPPAFCAA